MKIYKQWSNLEKNSLAQQRHRPEFLKKGGWKKNKIKIILKKEIFNKDKNN